MDAGVSAYAEDVRSGRYPGPEHSYSIDAGELAELHTLLGSMFTPTTIGIHIVVTMVVKKK